MRVRCACLGEQPAGWLACLSASPTPVPARAPACHPCRSQEHPAAEARLFDVQGRLGPTRTAVKTLQDLREFIEDAKVGTRPRF